MASYFDEHNCAPLQAGETPDHFLHFARLILTGGYWQDDQLQFSEIFGGRPPPPTSKKFMEELKTEVLTDKDGMNQCPICLKEGEAGESVVMLPCKHKYHKACITPWLNKTNSCPSCRHELPTDNEDYEEYRIQKKRIKEREAELEILHDSMFS